MVVKKIKPCGTKPKTRKPKVKKCICEACQKIYVPKNKKVLRKSKNLCDRCRVVIETKNSPHKSAFEERDEEDDYPWALKQKLAAGSNKLPSLKDVFTKTQEKEDLEEEEVCPEAKFFKICLNEIKSSVNKCKKFEYDNCSGQCSKACEYLDGRRISIKPEEEEDDIEEEEGEEGAEEENCRCIEEILAAKCTPAVNPVTHKCLALKRIKDVDGQYIKQAPETKPKRSKCPEPLKTIRTGKCEEAVKGTKTKGYLCDNKNVLTKLILDGISADSVEDLSKCKGATNRDLCANIVADPDPSPWDYTNFKDFKKCTKKAKRKKNIQSVSEKCNGCAQCESWETDLKEVLRNCKCCPVSKTGKPNF